MYRGLFVIESDVTSEFPSVAVEAVSPATVRESSRSHQSIETSPTGRWSRELLQVIKTISSVLKYRKQLSVNRINIIIVSIQQDGCYGLYR